MKSKMRLVPKVGKVYTAFDDGKISYTRLFKVKITKKLNLNKDKVSKRLLNLINYEIKNTDWIYGKNQTIIYRGKALNDDGTYDKDYGYQWFLRTIKGEWFGINTRELFVAHLDVDGSLLEKLDELFTDEL